MTHALGSNLLNYYPSGAYAAETMTDRPPSWRDRAVCKGVDPSIFYKDEWWSHAATVCDVCPVHAQCLEAGFDERDFTTYRGRMSPEERRKLARRRADRRFLDDRNHLAVTDEATAVAEGLRGVLAILRTGR